MLQSIDSNEEGISREIEREIDRQGQNDDDSLQSSL